MNTANTDNTAIESNEDFIFMDIIEIDSIDSEMLCNNLGCG